MRWLLGLWIVLHSAAAFAWEMDDAVLVSASQSFGAGASAPMLRIEAMHYSEELNLMLPLAGFGIDPRFHVEPTVLGLAIGAELAAMQNDTSDAPVTQWLGSRRIERIDLPEIAADESCEAAPALSNPQLQAEALVAEAVFEASSMSRRTQAQQRE